METYKVKWIDIWKGLSKGFSITILVGFALMILARAIKCGFDYGETFKYLTPLGWLEFYIVGCIAGSALMLVAALLLTAHKVVIKDDIIYGRSYWSPRRQIPINEVDSLEGFRSTGFVGFKVKSKQHGSLLFPVQIENLDQLIQRISKNLPDK